MGIHASFADVPGTANAYDGEAWSRSIAARIERWRAAVAQAAPLAPVPERGTLLAAVIAGMGVNRCSVLDIGGGGATSLLQVRENLPGVSLQWTVVEREAVCASAQQLVKQPDLVFRSSFPSGANDVAYMGSSLQYFEDWRGTLRRAAAAATRFVLIEDVPVVACESFAAAQRYYAGAIPSWFIGHDELMRTATECGLRCVLRDRFRASILGQWNGFPMDNYPETHRVGLASSFLFRVGA
ncbi:MAG: methyltransferase, TIGR04325 family [Phycisphaerae bacterium]|nr:methyltransferase, TIGR04325 family [Phycisphaerae bacterium]